MSNPDTVLETQNFVQMSAGSVLVTPTGGLQTTLAAALPLINANGMPSSQVRLPLCQALTIAGVPLTATAISNGAMGVSVTLGTGINLYGYAANSTTMTNTCLFEFDLPTTYVAGQNINVVVDSQYVIGGGTIGTHTIAAAAYVVGAAGTMSASSIIATAAQAVGSTAGQATFVITGTTCTPGGHMLLELTMVIQDTAGSAVNGQVNSVYLN